MPVAEAGVTGQVMWTAGHGARPAEDFVALLRSASIRQVVDVRAYPQSRRNPQFGQARLAAALDAAGIGYSHEGDLGGFREPRPASPNVAIDKFRGYADHMRTPEFVAALDRVLASSARAPTAVMCAESVPDACHRRYLSDAATARGWRVLHLLPGGEQRPHSLHPKARIAGDLPVYDGAGPVPAQPSLFEG